MHLIIPIEVSMAARALSKNFIYHLEGFLGIKKTITDIWLGSLVDNLVRKKEELLI